jgi:superkiller protein 3
VHICTYKEFQLLLCISEICLQSGDYSCALKHAITASQLHLSHSMLFFSHLQLARCYASQQDLTSLHNEYKKCLQLRTDCEIGWITLSLLEARYCLQGQNNTAAINHELFLNKRENVQNSWMALLELIRGQSFIWHKDFQSAAEALAQACVMWPEEGCLYLTHGISLFIENIIGHFQHFYQFLYSSFFVDMLHMYTEMYIQCVKLPCMKNLIYCTEMLKN